MEQKLREDPRTTGSAKYTDALYRRFSFFIHKRPGYEVNQTLYAANLYFEKILAIMCANNHLNMSLFAIVAYSCIHIFQVNIPLFACAIVALYCSTGVQQLLVKIAGSYLTILMVGHVFLPFLLEGPQMDMMHNVTLIKNKLVHNLDPIDTDSASNEAKQILNSMLTLMIIFLSCALHRVKIIRGEKLCVLFPTIRRKDADKGAKEFFMFIYNFLFYKFGVEICWFSIAMQLCLGHNAFDVGLCIMLWLTLVPRKIVHKYWPLVRAQVGIYMIFKYFVEASSEPLHPATKHSFLIEAIDKFSNLHEYISGLGIMWNFFVVLMISRQMWFFEGKWVRYGGTNDEKWQHFDDPTVKDEVEDYLLEQSTWLDVMKNVTLPNLPFLCLTFIIFTSAYTANLFSVGYILAATILLILGPYKLFMQNIGNSRRWFQYFLTYNLMVISAKFVLCTLVKQTELTFSILRVIFMDWSIFDANLPAHSDPGSLASKLSHTFYIDALYLGLLLLNRRFVESHYFLHCRREYRARDFLDEWGIYLQDKGAKMQLKKTTSYIAELKSQMENRSRYKGKESSIPSLKNANMNKVVEIPSIADKKEPFGLTIWLWSTTLVFRFIEFGYSSRLKEVKEKRQFFQMENKKEPKDEELDDLWKQFESKNLSTILWKPRPIQLLQAFWTCLRAHSQILCFLVIFYLQAFCYCSFYTLPLPLSVLYASKKYPRPHNYYWNALLIYSLIIIVGKLAFSTYLSKGVIDRLGGPSAYWEMFLFVAIIWHRSILDSVGLWNPPLCYQIKPQRVAFVDVYACILVIQFTCIGIVLANFSTFAAESKGEGLVVVEFDSDTVPVTFLVVTFLHVIGMALDRIFYVSNAFKSRKIFHSTIYLALHIWLFHFVPNFTHKPFGVFYSQQIYYFLQCIYLLLSAYQVRTCHSRCSAVSILCQSFSRVNYVAFMVYSSIPFLEPVRRSIDYFFTKTLLSREEFVLIESIFDLVFKVKCERVNEYNFLTNRQLRNKLKTFVGLVAISSVLVFIASPLIYYTMENSMTDHNHIKYLSLDLSSPLMGEMYQQRTTSFKHISERAYMLMKDHFSHHRGASTFLNEFTHEDVFVAKLPSVSLKEWSAFNDRAEIASQLRNVRHIRPTIKWVAERDYEGNEDFNDYTTVLKTPPENSKDPNPLAELAKMIESGKSEKPVVFPDLMTKFLIFHRTEPSSNAKILMLTKDSDPTVDDLLVQLVKVGDKFAWKLSENCDTHEYDKHTSKLPFTSKDCETLDIFIFSSHPPLFSFTKNTGGLIGLYAGVILSLWKYFSKLWKNDPYEIMFEEMVCPDKILQLCLDIYQCRITQQENMELELGQKLIHIFTLSSEFEEWTKGEIGVDARAQSYLHIL